MNQLYWVDPCSEECQENMWIVNMTHCLLLKMILQVNQKSCQFQELRPNTCIQLESLADKAFDPLHPFMEEMLTENCTRIFWFGTQMTTHMDAKISVDQATMGIVLHEGDLQICRDYYCSDPDRYDDRISYPIKDHFMRTGNWIGPVNSTVDY